MSFNQKIFTLALCFNKLKRYTINAVTLTRWLRAVVEDVPKVSAALVAVNFCSRHEKAIVCAGANGIGERGVEARPARTAVKLCFR